MWEFDSNELLNTFLCLHVHYWTQMKNFWEFLLECMVHWIIAHYLILPHAFPWGKIYIPESLTLDFVMWLTWANRMEMEVTVEHFWNETWRGLVSFFQLPCASAIDHKKSLPQRNYCPFRLGPRMKYKWKRTELDPQPEVEIL